MIDHLSMPLSVSDLSLLDYPKPWTAKQFVDNCWNVKDSNGDFVAYVVTISEQDRKNLFELLST